MKILNLVNLEKSDIRYTVQSFPDGQKNIVLNPSSYFNIGCLPEEETIFYGKVKIISRLNNMEDMGLIICAVACLRKIGVKEIHLYVPYLLGARSDRQFEIGGNSYLVDVIAPMINSQNFESVTVKDVHNPDVTAACIKNLVVQSNIDLVVMSLGFCGVCKSFSEYVNDFILISPDAGASKKIQKTAEAIGYRGDIITCSKERGTDGKLTKTVVPDFDCTKDLIIIDDICDGGATFINIGKVVKERWEKCVAPGNLYLIVTHGIFSKGFDELGEYFDRIYCTNSYSDKIGATQIETISKGLVKQLKII